jgi:hypothetical protein
MNINEEHLRQVFSMYGELALRKMFGLFCYWVQGMCRGSPSDASGNKHRRPEHSSFLGPLSDHQAGITFVFFQGKYHLFHPYVS